MTDQLFIMDRAYSSWSLRGWLLYAAFDLPVQVRHEHWPSPAFDAVLAEIAPSRTVPAVKSDGALIWDSLAIAETLAEKHPEASLWPRDPAARAAARSLTAEMHSGFSALRTHCPMNLLRRYDGFEPGSDVLKDVARAEELWGWARGRWGGEYLFGDYSIADVFFTPLASRLDTYGLSVGPETAAYVDALHRAPAFRQWRAMAVAAWRANPVYEFDLPDRDGWPGVAKAAARKIYDIAPVNQTCPYSGKPVDDQSLADFQGIVVGYCNTFCRDKSVADPGAWPATVELLARHNVIVT